MTGTGRIAMLVLAATALAGCRSGGWDRASDTLTITEPTTKSSHVLWTLKTLGTSSVTGMAVDTVGDDTVVTRTRNNRARRFILKGLVGYRGRIGVDRVDLLFDDTSVRIDDHAVKRHGPEGTQDVSLTRDGEDVFAGGDVIVAPEGIRGVQVHPGGEQGRA